MRRVIRSGVFGTLTIIAATGGNVSDANCRSAHRPGTSCRVVPANYDPKTGKVERGRSVRLQHGKNIERGARFLASSMLSGAAARSRQQARSCRAPRPPSAALNRRAASISITLRAAGCRGLKTSSDPRHLRRRDAMDRDGNIVQIGGTWQFAHARPAAGPLGDAGYPSATRVGMEVIAKDDKEVTPAQLESGRRVYAEELFEHAGVRPRPQVNPATYGSRRRECRAATLRPRGRRGIGGERLEPGLARSDRARARSILNRNQSMKVEGSGKLSVDVNAPKGTRVGAQGKGLFKTVEINRQTQMEPAKRGPADAGEE